MRGKEILRLCPVGFQSCNALRVGFPDNDWLFRFGGFPAKPIFRFSVG
jgi:hypothetical protein